MRTYLLGVILSSLCLSQEVVAQGGLSAQELPASSLFALSLEELSNLPIVSASKKEESKFNAPHDASILTREQIQRSGATSIPDALRLVPGVIVREQANGVYEVYLRGLDNDVGSSMYFTLNRDTLVMIDGRIVYSYFQGGTFWDTLPITLDDVARIEVVRGPMSSLYGPNAVTGVIAIFTEAEKRPGWHAAASSTGGGRSNKFGEDTRNTAQLSYRGNDKDSYKITVGTSGLARHQEKIFSHYTHQYSTLEEISQTVLKNPRERFPHSTESFEQMTINGYYEKEFTEQLKLKLSSGYQKSSAFSINTQGSGVFAGTRRSETYYGNSLVELGDFSFSNSWFSGNQGPWGASVTGKNVFWQHVDNFSSGVKYSYKYNSLELVPEIGYQNAATEALFLGSPGSKDLSLLSASLRGEYTVGSLRMFASGRGDRFSPQDTITKGYAVGSVYYLSPDSNIRASYGQSVRSFFILDTHLSVEDPTVGLLFKGNLDMDPYTVKTGEIGFRQRMHNILFETTAFHSVASNPTDFAAQEAAPEIVTLPNGASRVVLQYRNVPYEVEQLGLTTSIEYVPTNTTTAKFFFTAQDATVNGSTLRFAPNFVTSTAVDVSGKNHFTPTLYGGASFSYTGIKDTTLFSSLYYSYYSSHRFSNYFNSPVANVSEGKYLNDNCLLSLTAQYALTSSVSLRASIRNISLTGAKKQYVLMDDIDPTYLLGVDVAL